MTVTQDMTRFTEKVTKTIGRMRTKRTMDFLAKLAIELILDHVRKGYGLSKAGQSLKKLKGLSRNYKTWRSKGGKKYLGPHAQPFLSNLNFTGEMIDSMTILDTKTGRISIGPSKKKHSGSKLTNWKLANLHHNGEGNLPKRKFNYLSKNEITKVVEAFTEALTKELKNARLRRN